MISVADPAFSPRLGAPSLQVGRQHTILPNFPKSCMKLKKFGSQGRPKCYYVDPPLDMMIQFKLLQEFRKRSIGFKMSTLLITVFSYLRKVNQECSSHKNSFIKLISELLLKFLFPSSSKHDSRFWLPVRIGNCLHMLITSRDQFNYHKVSILLQSITV